MTFIMNATSARVGFAPRPRGFLSSLALAAAAASGMSASAGDYLLYATTIPNVTDWNNESYASGNPGCSNGCPCDDGDYATNAAATGYMTATDFQAFTLPPGEMIVSVRVNALIRFDNNESGEVRLKATFPSYGIETTRDSGNFTSDLGCNYEFSVAEGEITNAAGSWTQAMINDLHLGIRRLSSNPASGNMLRCKALRMRVLTAPIPVANDECGGAFAIGNGTTLFNSSDATTSLGALPIDCTDQIANDLWYVYTASCTGTATFTTCGGTSSDTVLAVYAGGCGGPIVGCNDDDPACGVAGPSTVTIPVTAGANYIIRIGGWDGPVTGAMFASCTPAPTIDECSGAALITGTSIDFNTSGATTSAPAIPLDCTDSIAGDVWYRYVATCNGTATFSTCGNGEPDTVLAIYSGPCGALSLLGCNDEADNCSAFGPSTVSVSVTNGSTYYVRLGGYDGIVAGTLTVSCAPTQPPPANDECAGSQLITGTSTSFNTANATNSAPSLPLDCTDSIVKDVWFRYVATCNGNATISTCGNGSPDTVLAVYSGSCGALSLIGCNDEDDNCGEFGPSTVIFPVTSGAIYYVRLGGYSGAVSGVLSATCAPVSPAPANDNCSGAQLIANGTTAFNTTSATTSAPDLPVGCTDLFGKDVWFRYVAPCTGNASFSTCVNATFDTALAIYSGACNSLNFIDCNDDSDECVDFGASSLTIPVTAGTAYLIRVGGFWGDSGTGSITASCSLLPGNPDLDGNGVVGQADLAILLGAWGGGGPADLDHDGHVGQGDLAMLLGAWH